MKTYKSNIFKFKGNPLKNGIEIFIYKVKEQYNKNYYEIGNYILKLRRVTHNKELLMFQDYTSIISEIHLEDTHDDILNKFFSQPIEKTLNIQSDKELIERVIGHALSIELRKNRSGWLVVEQFKSVFQVNEPIKSNNKLYFLLPGFKYSLIVHDDGSFNVVIDGKYRFYSSTSLRDETKENNPISKGGYFYNLCMVSDCPEKSDDFSTCRLANVNSSFQLSELISKKPTDIKIANQNLIEYYANENICHLKTLHRKIKNEKPVAKSVKTNDSGDNYIYPLDVLFRSPNFETLQNAGEDMKKIMKDIQPSPIYRLKKSEEYARLFESFKLLNETLELSDYGDGILDYSTIPSSPLVIGGGNKVKHPIYDLNKNGVYYSPSKEYKFIIVLLKQYSQDEINEIQRRLFNEKVQFDELIKNDITYEHKIVKNLNDINQIIENVRKNDCLIIVHNNDDDFTFKKKNDLSIKLIKGNVSNKGISYERLIADKWNKSTQRIFWLSVMGRLGIIPWIIDTNLSSNSGFIGMQTQYRSKEENTFHTVLNLYNNQGTFIEGRYIYGHIELQKQTLNNAIDELIENYSKIVFLYNGKPRKNELNILNEKFYKINEKEIKLIGVTQNNPIRFYSNKDGLWKAPRPGLYGKISQERYGIISTVTNIGTPKPVILKQIFGSKLIDEIEMIFKMTQSYVGTPNMKIALPSPVHTVQRVFKKLPAGIDAFKYKRMWFI